MNRLKTLFSLNNRVWSAGFLNIIAMALQLYALHATRDASGVSLPMLAIFVYVQLTFSVTGLRDRNKAQFWTMFLSGFITACILLKGLLMKYPAPEAPQQWFVLPILFAPPIYFLRGFYTIIRDREEQEHGGHRAAIGDPDSQLHRG